MPRKKTEGRYVTPACGSGFHVCALSNCICFRHSRQGHAAPGVICYLYLIASVELRDQHRALCRSSQRRLQRRHHRVSQENDVVDALISSVWSRQAQAASLPVRGALTSWWVPVSLLRKSSVSVPKAAKVEAQGSGGLPQGHAREKGNFCVLSSGGL